MPHFVMGAQYPPLQDLHALRWGHLRQHPGVGWQPAQVVTFGLYFLRMPVAVQTEVQRSVRRRPVYRAVRIVIVLLQSLVEDALVCAVGLKQKLKESMISQNAESRNGEIISEFIKPAAFTSYLAVFVWFKIYRLVKPLCFLASYAEYV